MGPWLVTPDELRDPETLQVEARVNDETRAKGDAQAVLFSFEEILAYASEHETIRAGEFFGSGTVGNCCGLEIGRFLESGDTVELQVDRVGVLGNRVIRRSVAQLQPRSIARQQTGVRSDALWGAAGAVSDRAYSSGGDHGATSDRHFCAAAE